MKAFYALVFICLVAIIAALIISAIAINDYLRIIKNQIFTTFDEIRSIGCDVELMRVASLKIRDDIAYVKDTIYDAKNDEPDEDDIGDPKEGWALSPCPICGEPARMAYDHDANGGYYVICGKHSRGADCNYSIVTGGPTRRIAANMWNDAAVHYTHLKLNRKKEETDANTDSN